MDWGSLFLYRFRTDIIAGGELLDSKTERVGIRSLKVVHQPDKDGHTFYIELNGRPVFAKGANYIPSDNFLPRVTPENYKKDDSRCRRCKHEYVARLGWRYL